MPPKSDGSGHDRKLLKQAADLLAAAGWKSLGNDVVDEEGAPLEVEFLIDAAVFERVLAPYTENLKRIGVQATIRQVDPVQYEQRQNDFDFDVIGVALSMSATPLDGLPQFFSSTAADTKGTYNYPGIKEKAVDAILDRLPGDQLARGTDRPYQGDRPGPPRPALLGRELGAAGPPGRALGRLRLAGEEEAGLRLHPRNDVVVRQGQGRQDRLRRIGGQWAPTS